MLGFRRRSKKAVLTLKEISERIGPVAREYNFRKVCVFGDYGRGEAHHLSHVGLYVVPGYVIGAAIGSFYLEAVDALSKEVDIAMEGCDPRYYDRIKDSLVCVYDREQDGPR